jgi:hypothetical protein
LGAFAPPLAPYAAMPGTPICNRTCRKPCSMARLAASITCGISLPLTLV